MKKILYIAFSLLILAGCNSKEREARLRQEELDRTFSATSYNYTPYALYSIKFKEISLPFKIDEAPDGGSIFVRNSSQETMDNGEKIYSSGENCCFIWNGQIDKPLRVRVVWSVVYDTSYYDGKSSQEYDERTSKKSAPGSRWCQATVDILPAAGSDRPDSVFFHFLIDGTVQAHLGTFKTGAPLAAELVKSHAIPLPEGQFCKQEIENPFYGVPRKPHRE
ncbi:membrane lipoprotein lipid attachment site-containing protein [Massilia antarctica]|uniref:membrane lipoprotein lipid attachment site-containing protein n=1 Tax=Massilia antarctica TaxID=2765360 RepID=UPI0006BB6262|nr:membrane lipoprotein lipid attachment site-containing protein [Massilia sp. H27-R4]MCY0912617.1 membrane lipoprotein lipid attachment site-containing protein [Massilia sp. H27-R4]